MQEWRTLSKFSDYFCRVLPRNLYPVSVNLKKNVRVNRVQQDLVYKPTIDPVSVFPPMVMKTKLQAIRFGKMVSLVVYSCEFFCSLKSTITFILRPTVPDHFFTIK